MKKVFEKIIEKLEEESKKWLDVYEYEECYKDCEEYEAYNKEKHHCPKFCKVIMEVVAKLKGMECEKDENNY